MMLPVICIRHPGTRDKRFSGSNCFYINMFIANHLRNKILCSQRNGHIIQIWGRIPRNKGLLEGIFCLCGVNVMHVLDPLFFTSSHGVGRLTAYQV